MSRSFLRALSYLDSSDLCLLTELQNIEGWKGPLGVVWSSTTGQAGPAVCPGPCPVRFLTSRGWRLHSRPGWPVPLLSHSRSENNIFWCLYGISCVSVGAHCFSSIAGHHWEQSGSISFSPPFVCFWCLSLLSILLNFIYQTSHWREVYCCLLAITSFMAQISLYVSQMFECMRFSLH